MIYCQGRLFEVLQYIVVFLQYHRLCIAIDINGFAVITGLTYTALCLSHVLCHSLFLLLCFFYFLLMSRFFLNQTYFTENVVIYLTYVLYVSSYCIILLICLLLVYLPWIRIHHTELLQFCQHGIKMSCILSNSLYGIVCQHPSMPQQTLHPSADS